MYEYTDPRRRNLVITWADGTVVVDKPSRTSDDHEPLREYLTSLCYGGIEPGDVPTAIYAHCDFCGRLHECKVHLDQARTHVENDWISQYYDVIAMVESLATNPHPMGGHDVATEELVTTIYVRIDGRA